MPFRIALALSLSVVLVSVTSWWRFSTVKYTRPILATVEQLDAYDVSDEDFLKDFTEPKTEEARAEKKPLSNTEIIGQQLIMDYVGLATSGEAGSQSINALAEQYAAIIPILSKSDKLTYQAVKTAPNTTDSLRVYSEKLGKIYITHSQNINNAYIGDISGISLDKAYFSFAQEASLTYNNTAQELLKLQVPLPLASAHLELINLNLSSVAAMNSILEAEKDPIMAFSGFVVANENSNKEIEVLKEIEKILKTNGV